MKIERGIAHIAAVARGQPAHAFVSLVNLCCLVLVIVGYMASQPSALGLGVFLGYWVNLLAVVTALGVLAWALVRAPSGGARIVLVRSWLALANGAVVLIAWAVFFIAIRSR